MANNFFTGYIIEVNPKEIIKMINNVQFTGNPAKSLEKGIKVATDAMESFAASRQNISKDALNSDALQNIAKESVAISKKPFQSAPKLEDSMIERADSYALSHGTPKEQINTGKLDYLA